MDNFFGIRLGVNIILLIVLGQSIISATTSQTVYSLMILFLLPVALDYFTHNPKLGKNIKRKTVGIWVPAIGSAVLIGLMIAQINIDFLLKFFYIKLLLWLPFLSFAIMAGVDWTSYSNPEEKDHREIIQRLARSETFDSPQKREKQYKNEKKRNPVTNEE